MNPVFRQVNLSLERWREVLEAYEDRTIFQTPEWLLFLNRSQKAEIVFAVLEEQSQVIGYCAALKVRKFGFKILGSPLPGWTTAYMGFILQPGIPRRQAIKAFIRFAFDELGCGHVEIMDRNLTQADVEELGFEYRLFSGFEIDLTHNEKQILANMSDSCRWSIRKAEKKGVTIEEAQDDDFVEEYYQQLQDVFKKQSLVPTYGKERVRDLILSLSASGNLLLLKARDPNGQCIATGIFLAGNGTMYFWGGASWRTGQHYRPNEAMHWYAMKYWKARGMRRYDMGGGGEYKEKFGGKRIVVPWIRESKYAGIRHCRNLFKQIVSWRQIALGRVGHFWTTKKRQAAS